MVGSLRNRTISLVSASKCNIEVLSFSINFGVLINRDSPILRHRSR